jgi:peptidoglycan/LPS O-acetylase OafA/YrhL
LGVEVWFSALFPLLVLMIGRIGWKKALLGVMLMAIIVRFAGRFYFTSEIRPAINFISDSVLGRLDEFMLGMLGATLYARRRMTSRPALQLVCGLALLTVTMVLWALWYRGNFPYAIAGFFNVPFDIGMLLVVNAVLVGCSPISRLFSVWPLQMSGMMCYSLYLWHRVIITKLQPTLFTPLSYGAFVVLTYAIAWLSYRYIEFGATPDVKSLLPNLTATPVNREPGDIPITLLNEARKLDE